MSNTFSVTSVVDHTTDAAYHTWVAEAISAIFTSIGLTQTADTGQTTNGGTTRPAINTAGGYVTGRFNDTAQSTSPVFFKLEFGTGASVNNPQMWITVGTGTNGSGTITGTTTVRAAVCTGGALVSTVTSYPSRFVWNPTYGFFGFVWKSGSPGTQTTQGGFFLCRSTNSSGAVTTDAVILITNSNTATGSSSDPAYMQVYSYLTAGLVTLPTQNNWGFWPLGLTTTVVSGQISLVPIFVVYPTLAFHACMGIGLLGETPIGNTTSLAMVGSTALTFLSVGSPFGATSTEGINLSPATHTIMMLWQ